MKDVVVGDTATSLHNVKCDESGATGELDTIEVSFDEYMPVALKRKAEEDSAGRGERLCVPTCYQSTRVNAGFTVSLDSQEWAYCHGNLSRMAMFYLSTL